MAIGNSPPPRTERLTSNSTVVTFYPMTDWMLAVGEDVVQAAIRVEGQSASGGNIVAKLAVQTATVRTDSPEQWALVATPGLTVTGVATATNNVAGGSVNQSVSVGTGIMWVRWGVGIAMSAAGNGTADVTLALSTVSKGQAVGTWRGSVLTAASTTATPQAVTGWIPAAWVQSVYAAIIVASGDANFRAKLVYRTATSSQNAPSAWADTADTGAGSGERVASDTGMAARIGTATQWVQLGISCWSTSGTSNAEVAVSVAVRRT